MSKQSAIIVDLDGTLANCDHRRHHLDKKDWPAFYAGIPDDKPNAWCVELVEGMRDRDFAILLVSGRPHDYWDQTVEWLSKYLPGWHQLFMRAQVDYRKDSIIKTEIYKRDIEPYFDVLFCVDDRQQVVDAWRALGLVCLQCHKGDF